jgi:uncharacterized protein with ATP-grasp and redox domains
MKADARCIICHMKQALRVFDRHMRSEQEKWERMKNVMEVLKDIEWGVKPIEIAEVLYPKLEELIGKRDVYEKEKKRSNEVAFKMLERFEKMIRESTDPLYDAAKLAIAGNLIDLGTPNWNEDIVYRKVNEILEKPFAINDFESFKEELSKSTTILYIVDNSGEIVFDRFFIEIMREYNEGIDVIVAAKSRPIINDVTVEEARSVMEGVADVIDSGMTIPGTIVERGTDEFRRLFFESDIVVSKGQGNFEGIVGERGGNVYFLLTVKCDVVSDFLKVPVGSMVFMKKKE